MKSEIRDGMTADWDAPIAMGDGEDVGLAHAPCLMKGVGLFTHQPVIPK